MRTRLLGVSLARDADILMARQRARQLAGLLGLGSQDQIRFATAVSEICRNAIEHGGGGDVSFALVGASTPQLLEAKVCDRGRGLSDSGPERTLKQNGGGLAIGLSGAERLVDRFKIESRAGHGTKVILGKLLPDRSDLVGPGRIRQIAAELAKSAPEGPEEELKRQNRELLVSLEQVRRQADELVALNRELEDTNRGVVALYAELDEKAEHLKRADELKTRFLSNMSHEFRTPLNSILALCKFLEARADGPLTPEQERQVGFIRKSAEGLSELVEDLLDLARVEAGKTVIRPTTFALASLFGALRGMLRPLLLGTTVQLEFEDTSNMPLLHGDEGKVSQILRNFISNALKFTERGEVRVSARLDPGGDRVIIAVKDTGIGIAPEHHQRIFEEFSQLESPVQRRFKGTGLGLPLSKRLATLMGGTVSLESTPGRGSIFTVTLPLRYEAMPEPAELEEPIEVDPERIPILVVEDNPADMMFYESILRHSLFQIIKAATLAQARRVLADIRPRAIVLDILLGDETSWKLLSDIKAAPEVKDIPVVVVSTVDDPTKAAAIGADAWVKKPVDANWLLEQLHLLTQKAQRKRVLVIDDDDVSRYVLAQYLAGCHVAVEAAANGADGLRIAAEKKPDLILLDLNMPDRNGAQVLEDLADDPRTAAIPAAIVTSAALTASDHARLKSAYAVVRKSELSTSVLQGLLDRNSSKQIGADA